LEYIKGIDYTQFMDKPLFRDEGVRFSSVVRAKSQNLLGVGAISLYGDRIVICDKTFHANELRDFSIQRARRLTIYTDEGTFVADFPRGSNLVKYMICGYHLKNIFQNITNEVQLYYGF
jgi:hypothetical protein